MPLLLGQTLRDRIADAMPLPIDQLVDLAIQITDGLEAAHNKNIIHRDQQMVGAAQRIYC